ncbi:MAG: hypothetical protein KVP17_001256 [Porospora cf. gigantea B]|uniref:uncharacterized protein n=1 Tax=Porospora cf. gigantea B TaxID=2853592 RepID=UPI003571C189|nr:MAG: hypothetical protein KVP17_001256 [Porospora cf. gigantea B]
MQLFAHKDVGGPSPVYSVEYRRHLFQVASVTGVGGVWAFLTWMMDHVTLTSYPSRMVSLLLFTSGVNNCTTAMAWVRLARVLKGASPGQCRLVAFDMLCLILRGYVMLVWTAHLLMDMERARDFGGLPAYLAAYLEGAWLMSSCVGILVLQGLSLVYQSAIAFRVVLTITT